jgi:hypothetical protein
MAFPKPADELDVRRLETYFIGRIGPIEATVADNSANITAIQTDISTVILPSITTLGNDLDLLEVEFHDHSDEHLTGGLDPIPRAGVGSDGLMYPLSGTQKDVFRGNGTWLPVKVEMLYGGVAVGEQGTLNLTDGTNVSVSATNDVGNSRVNIAITGTQTPRISSLLDTNGNTLIGSTATASAVNYCVYQNGATGSPPRLRADGSDTNINLRLDPKGTGKVTIGTNQVVTTADVVAMDANARVDVALEGSSVGKRRQVNFVTGTDISFTVTDDAGNERVDVEISGTSREWFAEQRLAANGTTTSATNSDAGLSFSIGSSQTWSFCFQAFTQCSAANGHKWGLDIPTGATVEAIVRGSRGSTASIISDSITTDDGQSAAMGTGTYTAGGWVEIVGTIVNSTTAGSVKLRYASSTGGDTTTIKAGSYVEAHRIS